MKIRIAGFGGQGIVMTGMIIGAAAGEAGKNVVQNQSYGSSARGGACTSDVTISDDMVLELEPHTFDLLCALNQQSYDSFIGQLNNGGLLFIDPSMVKTEVEAESKFKVFSLNATDTAHQKFGNKMVANVIMLGLISSAVNLIDSEILKETVLKYVPAKTIELNKKAFEYGYELGKEMIK